MFGYISKKEHQNRINHITLEYRQLLRDYNNLVCRINILGGEAFLKHAKIPNNNVSGFSAEDIRSMINLCHPDKHNGKKSATRITQMLIAHRDSFNK
jgi:hypothetical protein